jgi:hypothetical protein
MLCGGYYNLRIFYCEPEESNPGSVADFFLKEKSSDFV